MVIKDAIVDLLTEQTGSEGLTGKMALSAIRDCCISGRHNHWDFSMEDSKISNQLVNRYN